MTHEFTYGDRVVVHPDREEESFYSENDGIVVEIEEYEDPAATLFLVHFVGRRDSRYFRAHEITRGWESDTPREA